MLEPVTQITLDFSPMAIPEDEPGVQPPSLENEQQPKKRGRKPRDPTTIVKKVPGKRGRKSLKDEEAMADLIEVPEDELLFQKQYYTMGEVSEMFKVNLSLIRFWENEFDILKPKKNKKGDRFFRPLDIKNLQLIHHLLRQRKYTVEGAKDYLKNKTASSKQFEILLTLQRLRTLLLEIKASL